MPLIRKIGFYVFLAASLSAAIWGWLRLRESKSPAARIEEHIPASASVVIETQQVHDLVQQLTRQNLIWNSLLTEEAFIKAQKGIQYLDSLTRSSAEISAMLDNNALYWSFVKTAAGQEHLIQFRLKEQKDEETVLHFFSSVFATNSSVSSFKAYQVNINGQKWLATCLNGIVYFCSDLALLQQSAQLGKTESLAGSTDYNQLRQLNGRQRTQIYVNHRLSGLFSKTLFSRASLLNPAVELNALTCTGYTLPDSSSFTASILKQETSDFRQIEKLPDQPSSFTGIALSQPESFFRANQSLLNPAVARANEAAWQSLNDSALYNLQQEFYETINDALVLANYRIDAHDEQLLQIGIRSSDKTAELMGFISDSTLVTNEGQLFHIPEQRSHLFAFHQAENAMHYAFITGDELILATSREMMNYYTKCAAGSLFLGKNQAFMSYANDNLFTPAHCLYYENYDLMKAGALPRLINSLELNTGEDVLSHLSLSMKSHGGAVQLRLHAMHRQEKERSASEKDVLWSYGADSALHTPVFLFTNHLTQEHELCFQDRSNTLYLISATGKALWKKPLNEAIRSDVYTVDLFKNGKLQMLFNTDHYLHLIDRNGNYVQGYPVKLPQRATSAITVLDYDKTRDYRIFIACADKKIYNYSLYGVKTEGYVPLRTEALVTLPVNYVHVGASDYLVTADDGGKLYAFSRKGEGRIDFKNKVVANLQAMYVWPGTNLDNTRIVYVDDKNNLLNEISLSDKKETFKLGDELNGFRVAFGLLNDDKQTDLILYGDGAIHAYDLFSGKLLESFNPQAVYRDARFAYTENSQQVIGFDQAGEKLDLIDLAGKPLYSIGQVTHPPLVCELYKNGKTYLITINGSVINCRRLM